MQGVLRRYNNPPPNEWAEIAKRPVRKHEDLSSAVHTIIQSVRQSGDLAIRDLTKKFDGVDVGDSLISDSEISSANALVPKVLQDAIIQARRNIEEFHMLQVEKENPVETMPGVMCWRRSTPIQSIGMYIPGGSAPLFSTVLMLGVPASIAKCPNRYLCTPPRSDGTVHPAILFTAAQCGIHSIYRIGGAQAIAALAFGTESVPRVDKIFGPGNTYVTEAKEQVQRMGVAIDMPAGPSEVLVFADQSSNPAFVAADLLSQAEHGPDSQVMLVATDSNMITAVESQLAEQLVKLPRREIAAKAVAHSKSLYFPDRTDGVRFINAYAPEHLILAVNDAQLLAKDIVNAGSVFLGHFTPESVGDYASGTNHTLPTNGWARSFGGLSLDSFVKKITFQHLTKDGLKGIAHIVQTMANAESLVGHERAVSVRLHNEDSDE
ncbi:MAG: histidinol dehydrogenase [Saprospiraceae bacterium]|nr:histidinol dehydrogenase [Saprospiraceae bacterium]